MLSQKASAGSANELRQLVDWAGQLESERTGLKRQLRKQQLDFSTLFEIVGQTSARSLDLAAMQTYLMRTVSGHFTTPKLLILRKQRMEDPEITTSAAQGLHDVQAALPSTSPFCRHALARRLPFSLEDLPQEIAALPEVAALTGWGMRLAVPLIQEVETPDAVLEGFLLLGARLSQRAYEPPDLKFLNTLGKMLAICLRNEALYRRSIIDDLTGVASRGHFDACLSQEISRIETYGHRSIALLMMDVDHFKDFNDTHGHQTGDRILQELAATLEQQVRKVDLVARYGGEEFAIILLEIDRSQVMDVAERLRRAVANVSVTSPGGEALKITASFGAACFPDDAENKFELIQRTDQALYRAKDKGRNRVLMASPGCKNQPGGNGQEKKEEDGSRRPERRNPAERLRAAPGKVP